MDKAIKDYNDARTVGNCVEKDIWQAHVYYSLLSKLIVNIRQSKVYNECTVVFDYIENACETKYVLALGKIFGDTKEGTLWQLLKLAKELPDEEFERKLQTTQSFLHDDLRQQRKEVLDNFTNLEQKIKEIREKISPLRNTERAHNIPWISKKANELTWGTVKEWLDFAEKTFTQCMNMLGESCISAGNFESAEFDSQIEHCVSLMSQLK